MRKYFLITCIFALFYSRVIHGFDQNYEQSSSFADTFETESTVLSAHFPHSDISGYDIYLKYFEITDFDSVIYISIEFSDFPSLASIYELEKPRRIVLDFPGVVAEDKIFKAPVNPIERITFRQFETEPPFSSVVLALNSSVDFTYDQNQNRIVLLLKQQQKLSRKNLFIILGSGAALIGGTVTGIILGSESQGSEDLGTPPPFPE